MSTITLTPSSNLDTEGALEFEKKATDLEPGSDVELDLSNVQFIASSGIRVIMKIAQNNNLVLSHVHPNVRLVLKTSGLDSFLTFKT